MRNIWIIFTKELRSYFVSPVAYLLLTMFAVIFGRSEEHTSELQSPCNLVCRLLLEKKKTHLSRRPEHGMREAGCAMRGSHSPSVRARLGAAYAHVLPNLTCTAYLAESEDLRPRQT